MWNNGARRQRANHQHSATPLATSKLNLFERAVLARGALDAGEKIWYYPAMRIHGISERASEMTMGWYLSTPVSPEYVLRVPHSTSASPVSPYTNRRSLTMCLEALIEWGWGYTWRPRSSELRDALSAGDRARSEIHLEARIEWTERYTPSPWSSEVGDAIGVWDWVNSEIHLKAVIEGVWRCNWRPTLSKLRDALGGGDRASSGRHLEAEIEWTQSCSWRPWWYEFGDSLWGRGRASLEMQLETEIEWTHISKMNFSHWKPPGVSERMWSVNLDVSISGEYQALGGHSGYPSE